MTQGAAAGGSQKRGKLGVVGAQRPRGTLGVEVIVMAGAVITGLAGGAITAAGGIGMASRLSTTARGSEPMLAALAPAEIADAMATLDAAASQQAVADARACKAPIAWVTLVRQPGGVEGAVRIRSGSYLSPIFHVTEAPQRVAIPYPAPYATGRGVLGVVGEAKGLTIYLSPGWNIPALNGGASIDVQWTPANVC
jgi:hypothetical protein